MRHLVLANGHQIRLVDQDVRRLQQRISEKSIGAQVLAAGRDIADLLLLLLVARHPFQPSQRRNHRKQQMQFRVLRHPGLHKQRRPIRIEPGTEPIERDIESVLFHVRGVGVIGGQGVPVGDKEITFILALQTHPVVERAHVVAQVQLAGGTHAAQHALGQRVSTFNGLRWVQFVHDLEMCKDAFADASIVLKV